MSFCFSVSTYDGLFFIWLFYLLLESVTVWGMASGCFLVFRVWTSVLFIRNILARIHGGSVSLLGGISTLLKALTGWSSLLFGPDLPSGSLSTTLRFGFGCVNTSDPAQ